MERDCDNCGATYSRPPSLIGRYCSNACAIARRKQATTTYRRVRKQPDHPLAGRSGLVAEARAALYDAIGPGPHRCHWCGREVNWTTGQRGNGRDMLVADHVNADCLDDSLGNLVASCGSCNGTRMNQISDDEVFVTRKNGTRLRATRRVCEVCSSEFLAVRSEVAVGKGRFCSRSCAGSGRMKDRQDSLLSS